MKLLDTPQWAAMTVRQKNIMLAVQGEGELRFRRAQREGELRFRRAQREDIKALENLGLLTVDWSRSVAAETEER